MRIFNTTNIQLAIFFLFFLPEVSRSQDISWKLGIYSFFDNVEFAQSTYKKPQTMSGVMVLPEVGLKWDSVHKVHVGVDVLREFGSNNEIDNYFLTAYYSYNRKPFRFLMGAFPRNYALERYPRLFFQDSVAYYRPNINGILWEISENRFNANTWLDWTGKQSPEQNETFLAGFSGKYAMKILYIQYFTYYFHFASKMDPVVPESLHDNGLMLISAGINLNNKTFFDKLDINAGWAIGLERSRSENTGFIKQHGFLSELIIEKWETGIFNSFYAGNGQMHFYSKHGNKLYWGDPIYRAKVYDRLDMYISLFNNRNIHSKIVYSLHFAENRMYHEQALKVSVDLEKK